MGKGCGTQNEQGVFNMGSAEKLLSDRGQGIKTKKCLYEGVIVPMALYGPEVWSMKSAERRKVNVLEMK